MAHQFSAIMFTDGVKAVQTEFGSREKQAVFAERAPANDVLTERDCPPEQLAAVALDDYKSRIERIPFQNSFGMGPLSLRACASTMMESYP